MTIINAKTYGALEVAKLKEFEAFNDVTFPEDYVLFLNEYNGGSPVPDRITFSHGASDVQTIFGMHDGPDHSNFFHYVEVFHNRIPAWYVPIATDSGGNLYIMSLWEGNKGVIGFWNHEEEAQGDANEYYDNVSAVADSFSDFLRKIG